MAAVVKVDGGGLELADGSRINGDYVVVANLPEKFGRSLLVKLKAMGYFARY